MRRLNIGDVDDPKGMFVTVNGETGVRKISQDPATGAFTVLTTQTKDISYNTTCSEWRAILGVIVWSPGKEADDNPLFGTFKVDTEQEAEELFESRIKELSGHKYWDEVEVSIVDGLTRLDDGTWVMPDNPFVVTIETLYGQSFEAGGSLHVYDPIEGWVDWSDSLPTTRVFESGLMEGLAYVYRKGDVVEWSRSGPNHVAGEILQSEIPHMLTLLASAGDPESMRIKGLLKAAEQADPLAFITQNL